jgi:HAD superfamily hydrolase (TIGR01509 family)
MTINYVCFDIGGVANVENHEEAILFFNSKFGQNNLLDFIHSKDNDENIWRKFQNGQINSEEYFSKVLLANGFDDTINNKLFLKKTLGVWCGEVYKPMVQLAENLKLQGIHTSVLSNNNEIMYNQPSALIKDVVNVALSSHEIGISKPHFKAFEILLEKIGASDRPEEVLFIDNMLYNVKAALSVGMQAFHFAVDDEKIGNSREQSMTNLLNYLRNNGVNL